MEDRQIQSWQQYRTKKEDKSAEKYMEEEKYQERSVEQHMLELVTVCLFLAFYTAEQPACSQETLT